MLFRFYLLQSHVLREKFFLNVVLAGLQVFYFERLLTYDLRLMTISSFFALSFSYYLHLSGNKFMDSVRSNKCFKFYALVLIGPTCRYPFFVSPYFWRSEKDSMHSQDVKHSAETSSGISVKLPMLLLSSLIFFGFS